MTAYHYVITWPSVALTFANFQTMPYFYTLSRKGTFSKMLLNIKSVFKFSVQPLTEHLLSDGLNATLPKIEHTFHVKYRLL